MQPVAATLLSLSCLVLARPGLALEGAETVLEVQRGPGTEQCIEVAPLERAVEARLQRAVFTSSGSAKLRIRLVLERHADLEWSAELKLETAAGVALGQRSIVTRAPHCSALDDSLALVVALLVDTQVAPPGAATGAAQPPASAAPPPPTPGAAAPPTTPIQLPRDTLSPREPWHADTGLAGAVAAGILPGAALGAELSFGAMPPSAPELRLSAALYGERESRTGSGNSGAHFEFANLALELCPWWPASGGLKPFLCAGQSVGRLKAEAFGFDQNASAARLTFALLARVGLAWSVVGPLSLQVNARAELPVTRSVFVYGSSDGLDRGLYRTSPILGVLQAGLVFALR